MQRGPVSVKQRRQPFKPVLYRPKPLQQLLKGALARVIRTAAARATGYDEAQNSRAANDQAKTASFKNSLADNRVSPSIIIAPRFLVAGGASDYPENPNKVFDR
jgi:hypothetical protein